MNLRPFFLAAGLFLASGLAAFAVQSATILTVKGSVQSSEQGALQPGSTLAVGGVLRTGGGSEVSLRFFDGTVTTVLADSEVTLERLEAQTSGGKNLKETTVLNLGRGTVVASLDPAKKDITSFSVRTPRGVAIARGTVFAVRVTQDKSGATVGTMSGTVTYVTDRGEVTVSFGQVSSGSNAMTVEAAVAADPSLASVFGEAAVAVAGAIGQGAITNTDGTPNLAAAVLAAVVKVAVEANPTQKGVLVEAITAVTGGANSNLASVVAQASNPSTGTSNAGGNGNNGGGNATILPALDNTQVVVSPSRN